MPEEQERRCVHCDRSDKEEEIFEAECNAEGCERKMLVCDTCWELYSCYCGVDHHALSGRRLS